MPKLHVEPANDRIFVVDEVGDTVIDGISLPDNERQKDMILGTVIFVGPEAPQTFVGDKVYYGPYAGKTIVFNGTQFRLIRQGHIEAYVRVDDEQSEIIPRTLA